jgi:hypothetical protein
MAAPLAKTGAEEFLFDDFDGYTDDVGLMDAGWEPMDVNTPSENATWTVLNPGGRLNPPTENGAPSLGFFLISDSDAAGGDNPGGSGMSHDIWSPYFDCTGAAAVWIHFDLSAQLNNNGQCVFDVDVSTDDAATWTNVFRRVAPGRGIPPLPTTENADGFYGRAHIDISTQAAGKPDVRFRFRHFEPSDDWWIAVDNLVIDDQPPPGGAVTLLLEHFLSGIPAAWTVHSPPGNTEGSTWNAVDYCQRTLVKFNGGQFADGADGRRLHRLDASVAIMDGSCRAEAAEDEYLITPPLDCTKATDVFLHWKSNVVVDGGLEEVLLSLDGGETFEATPVFSYNLGALLDPGEEPFYAEHVLAVPEAVGRNGVAFAFHYVTGGANAAWGIDDVRVSVNGTGFSPRNCENRELTAADYDPAVNSITLTWKNIPGDEGFRVLANDVQLGPDLSSSATTFTHSNPPAGATIVYKLQSLKAGAVDLECAAPPVKAFTCPGDLVACTNHAARTVAFTWQTGKNLAATGFALRRNGTPTASIPLTQGSYTDTPAAPGVYHYELALDGGDAGQCPALPLTWTAVIAGGDIILFDDFQCYADDAALLAAGWETHEENTPEENAAWTVLNPGGRDNPPERDGTPTAGTFLVSDSDAATGANPGGTGMSHDVWSPPFSCMGRTVVWLHMDTTLVMNNNGQCVFDVDVTSDDGATWTNVFRRVAPARGLEPLPLADIPEGLEGGPQVGNADGFFGPLDVDISAVAAGKPSVQFRLRDFEPNDDWWFAVDNVRVDSTPVTGGSREILPLVNFSQGIPNGWAVESIDDVAPWAPEDPCLASLLNANGGIFPDLADGHQIHHFDQVFALVFRDFTCVTPPRDESLTTPVLDLSGTASVFLHFKSAIAPTDAVSEVLLSLDGKATFEAEPVFSYQRGGGMLRDAGNAEMIYNEYILEVPRAANQPSVAFAFHHLNPGGRPFGWAIDDVRVTAEGGGATLRRGDADGTSPLNITDPIFVLNFLFAGGEGPTCLDAADADDSGTVNITDPIRVLNFLFAGGPPPLPPGPNNCGADPTEDALPPCEYDC